MAKNPKVTKTRTLKSEFGADVKVVETYYGGIIKEFHLGIKMEGRDEMLVVLDPAVAKQLGQALCGRWA